MQPLPNRMRRQGQQAVFPAERVPDRLPVMSEITTAAPGAAPSFAGTEVYTV